jgi:vacuolar-type H+-ATPase subunit E/Vma4
MALDRLVDAIEARARDEIAEEKARIDSEKNRIVSERDRQLQEIGAEAQRRATELAARERTRVVASARLKAKQLDQEAREAVTTALLDVARQELAEFTKDPEYAKLVRRLYKLAVERLGPGCVVRGRAEDGKLLRSIAGSGYSDEPLPILGGFVAATADGRRRLNLSFDDLLRLREDAVRAVLPK